MKSRFFIPLFPLWTVAMTVSGLFFQMENGIFASENIPISSEENNQNGKGSRSEPSGETAPLLTLYGTTWTVNPYVRRGQFEGEYTPPDAVPKRMESDPESPFLPLPEEYETVPGAVGFFRSVDGGVYWFESDDNGHFVLNGLPEGDYEVISEQNAKGLRGRKNVTVYYTDGKTGLMVYLGPTSSR